jgi:phospholipid-translocating P-type ATPase (flippase)
VVFVNSATENEDRCVALGVDYKNATKTAAYTPFNFIPLNLFKQYHRAANVYFTVLICMQFVDTISPYSPYTTLGPFLLILLVSMAIDLSDDMIKIRADRVTNNRTVHVLAASNQWSETLWSNLRVGDVVQLECDEHVPADMLILNSSADSGAVFVETKDLDGESNLKRRKALTSTQGRSTPDDLVALKGTFKTEVPNVNLEELNGTFYHGNGSADLECATNDEMLLRGTIIRNTASVQGIVVYAGSDTKLMKNGGKATPKRTQLDGAMNGLIVKIAAAVIIMAIIASIWNKYYLGHRMRAFRETYNWADTNTEEDDDLTAVLAFFTYLITLSQIVPISLYVSVELIRAIQSTLIDWDILMYDSVTDCPAMARTRALTEELGQIEYIMSDKTGTLTNNVMSFHSCSIAGENYVRNTAGAGGWVSAELQERLGQDHQAVVDFFRSMAICHTVQVDTVQSPPEYQAQSPDEKALVEAARDTGFEFISDLSEVVKVRVGGVTEAYTRLAVIEFNSDRKRMSCVVRTADGQIVVYTKGADNVILERISAASAAADKPLLLQNLNAYARNGLRTLVFARKIVSNEWYDNWLLNYQDALTTTDDTRDAKILAATEEVESGLTLLGASAIEDELQDQVPETIAMIKEAGIKLWVLTGDKQETAINIGYSCNLLSHAMQVHEINGDDHAKLHELLIAAKLNVLDHLDQKHGLVIDGPSLLHVLMPRHDEMAGWDEDKIRDQEDCNELFLEVASQCDSVICARVTPLQKAKVVRLVKRGKNATTLAIGDGANDVNMIRAASIGIGISGLEGRQAVTASDYSIAQFRFLQRLLLVHGRWSYYRMGLFMKYFFYKNVACFLVQFWYTFNNAGSSQTLFDPTFITMFNVAYTSLPIIVVGTLEQDVDDLAGLQFPILYKAGILGLYYDSHVCWHSLLRGVLHSLLVYYPIMAIAYSGGATDSHGIDQSDLHTISYTMVLSIVFLTNLQLAMELKNWMWAVWVSIIAGPAFYLLMTGVVYQYEGVFGKCDVDDETCFQSRYVGTYYRAHTHGFLYQIVLLINCICLLPEHFFQFLSAYIYPTPADLVREHTILMHAGKFTKKFRPSAVAENVAEARKRQSAVSSLPGIDNAASDDQGAVISHPSLMKDPSMIVRRVAADGGVKAVPAETLPVAEAAPVPSPLPGIFVPLYTDDVTQEHRPVTQASPEEKAELSRLIGFTVQESMV